MNTKLSEAGVNPRILMDPFFSLMELSLGAILMLVTGLFWGVFYGIVYGTSPVLSFLGFVLPLFVLIYVMFTKYTRRHLEFKAADIVPTRRDILTDFLVRASWSTLSFSGWCALIGLADHNFELPPLVRSFAGFILWTGIALEGYIIFDIWNKPYAMKFPRLRKPQLAGASKPQTQVTPGQQVYISGLFFPTSPLLDWFFGMFVIGMGLLIVVNTISGWVQLPGFFGYIGAFFVVTGLLVVNNYYRQSKRSTKFGSKG